MRTKRRRAFLLIASLVVARLSRVNAGQAHRGVPSRFDYPAASAARRRIPHGRQPSMGRPQVVRFALLSSAALRCKRLSVALRSQVGASIGHSLRAEAERSASTTATPGPAVRCVARSGPLGLPILGDCARARALRARLGCRNRGAKPTIRQSPHSQCFSTYPGCTDGSKTDRLNRVRLLSRADCAASEIQQRCRSAALTDD